MKNLLSNLSEVFLMLLDGMMNLELLWKTSLYSVTIFKNQYDNKTHRRMDFNSWFDYQSFLYKLSKVPLEGKKDAQLISPATYEDGSTRSNKNVTGWGSWCAVDVDDYEVQGNLEDDLRNKFGHYMYVCYSTASSTNHQPKFRIVFPIVDTIEKDSIKHFWFALQSELGEVGDKQTKDLSRMYFIPAAYNGANNFCLLYTSPSPRDRTRSRMPSSA